MQVCPSAVSLWSRWLAPGRQRLTPCNDTQHKHQHQLHLRLAVLGKRLDMPPRAQRAFQRPGFAFGRIGEQCVSEKPSAACWPWLMRPKRTDGLERFKHRALAANSCEHRGKPHCHLPAALQKNESAQFMRCSDPSRADVHSSTSCGSQEEHICLLRMRRIPQWTVESSLNSCGMHSRPIFSNGDVATLGPEVPC